MCSTVRPLVCYLVEWYRPGLTEQSLGDIAAKLDAGGAMLCAEGTEVPLLVTIAVPTDEVLYGLFAAHSSHAVIQACYRAGIPLERLSADVAAQIGGKCKELTTLMR